MVYLRTDRFVLLKKASSGQDRDSTLLLNHKTWQMDSGQMSNASNRRS